MNKLLVVCGPTATGKTALAAKIAEKLNGELISADSRQVYRGMDLVTGKERPDIPVWLYDVADPDSEFSVSHWVKLAIEAVSDIGGRNKLPIVVGGTGLYIKALLYPLSTIDIPPNKSLRTRLAKHTVQELQKMIPESNMNESDCNNPRRLIRKIEIASAGNGQTPSGLPAGSDTLIIGLTAPIDVIDRRIEERLKKRLKDGMQQEIDALVKKYDSKLPSMSAVGINEHAYARRQLTWFRGMKKVNWFDITMPDFVRQVTTKVSAWYTHWDDESKV